MNGANQRRRAGGLERSVDARKRKDHEGGTPLESYELGVGNLEYAF